MGKTRDQRLRERKESSRTFKEKTSLGKIEDRISALEFEVEELKLKCTIQN